MDDLEKIQETNWWRVCKLLIEVGTEQLLYLFENAVPRSNLRKFLVDNKSDIEQHRKKETDRQKRLDLNDKQFTLLYFEKEMKKQTDDELDKEYRKTKIGNWDITLITCLLNYFCKNRKLKLNLKLRNIWNEIRDLRNDLHAHIKRKKGFKMTDTEYKQHWQNVKKVLRDLNKITLQVNIEKKIESIQKETVVDGDQLKALIKTFDNWVQIEMGLSEKLNQMEEKSDEQYVSLTNTVNDGVTTVTEAVKGSEATVTEAVKESETTVTEAVKESETTVTEAVKESETTVTETVKKSETAVKEEVKEGFKKISTQLKQHQQILAQMTQHQNQNQGAVATDRVPKEMHRVVDTLPSELSHDAEQGGNNYIMDTETLPGTSGNTGVAMTDRMMTEMHNGEEIPDEGNNSVMETQTLPASSGNIAVVGESVLADRLLEMRVNEPVESRDESASILQSNLLTEQRRHNEMPPGIGYIDCLILYAEVDRDDAVKFKKHLINDIKIKKHGPVVALLYDDPKLRSLSESKIQYLQKVVELSTYKMLYVTKNFVEAKWEIFKTEVCIVQTIENKEMSWSVVPVFPQTNETFSVPGVLKRLVGFHYKENDEHYKESLTSLIEARVKIRVKRNQSLVEEQQQRADEEIVDSHPQQDAFIQTSGQTPGASAGIQETNTIAGAVATDRMLDGMHNGEETLSSQVSMDAEPDEENNSFMEPQTVPASSGNIAARGESVLADGLLEMTVNEPVGSRDESASNLQSNLLIKQLRHNVMPPEIGYIDCLILYAEVDRDNALKFKKHLINDIKIKKHGPVVALLYDDPELCSLAQSQLQYLQKVFELSTYKMLYVTKDFVEDKWENFKTEVFIVQTIKNEETQWSVVPVYPQTNETFSVPDVLERLVGFHYNENDEHYKESLTNLIEARVDVRVTRNQSLIEEQQQRTDEEISDSHSQQDAFVQTSGQTTGASAEIQEANTIPGAVATDRMLHGMHRVVDTLPSELSHDAEQGGNNNIMDTETLTGTSGNTGAVGGSVLADPLRDDSLSSLQSNFLTEQEGDTLDDVDLPSSCHDDKMEQKEEAQVASLAEIKQKKKKKKKKKTRR